MTDFFQGRLTAVRRIPDGSGTSRRFELEGPRPRMIPFRSLYFARKTDNPLVIRSSGDIWTASETRRNRAGSRA